MAKKRKSRSKKKVKKNPSDPNLLARSVIEAAIGEPLGQGYNTDKPKKNDLSTPETDDKARKS